MRITEATPATIHQLWGGCSAGIPAREYVDDLATVVADALYARFADSLVMARVFLTVSFSRLPDRQRDFARELARSVNLESRLGPSTPVHSLLATRGCVETWNDPRKSTGHVAIPLLSEALVGSIPMMSRLLKELGLPLTWVQDPGAAMLRQTIGSEVGFFYVEDAPSARDELGRLIIPAREFVSQYSVKSVFAVGGIVFGGATLVIICFSRERVESRTVRLFMPLINLFKAALISRGSLSRVFRPTGGTAEAGGGSTSRVGEP